jgi:two-component system, response regulator RegA
MSHEPDSSGAIRILVVDDDETFRTRLMRALAARGLQPSGAPDGQRALELALEHRPHRAVVDLRMPGHGGLQVVRQLMALDDPPEVVILTGYGSIATAVEALRLGAVNYLTKPADTDEILAAFTRKPTDSVPPDQSPSLARVEWEHIHRILGECGGNISEASRRLGIHRRSLQRKLSKLPPIG